ncbi:protein mono-ADP-ribosyltransferase PARP11-like [Parambassis ranga]|uniref:Poly [ADP-ribose] polymerase n=1 Tax=Parambassis ranga TaxID=210632 RepID=A0A6P7KGP7_9TELE|nr:protein mono-ADP-ribosyltransferase PARP11-like [Parambassis ranga]
MPDNEEHMDTSDTPWFWYYLADCGRWHRFEDGPVNPLKSEDIEKYYLINTKGILSTSSDSGRTRIDFSAMLQIDLTTGRQRRIQRGYHPERSCPCFSAAPVFWETVDPTRPYQLILLSALTPEFSTVADYVRKDGLLDKPILTICRIQNLDLWDIYCRKKKQLMRIQGVGEIQERRLFHGTEATNVDSICKFNFDLGLAGQHGHVYGKGIYFARHASVADKYAGSSTDLLQAFSGMIPHVGPSKILFLARVMVGKSKVGRSYFTKPNHGSAGNSHDSCVDDANHPNIFVIFDPNQIYPEYLIQYR